MPGDQVEKPTEMKSEDVVWLLQLLEQNGIKAWLDGGWGVDALLGEQTRRHKDVDLVVALSDVPKMQALLIREGFAVADGGPPMSFVLEDGREHSIDVHPVTWDEQGNGVYRMQSGEDWLYPAAGFAGSGSVGGRQVRCLTAEIQMLYCHTGYELTEKDFREMDALHQRFGVAYPPGYGGRSPDRDRANG